MTHIWRRAFCFFLHQAGEASRFESESSELKAGTTTYYSYLQIADSAHCKLLLFFRGSSHDIVVGTPFYIQA